MMRFILFAIAYIGLGQGVILLARWLSLPDDQSMRLAFFIGCAFGVFYMFIRINEKSSV